MNNSIAVGSNGGVNLQRKVSNQNIQVYVRVRPMNSRERCIRSEEVVEVPSPREVVARHSPDSKHTKKFSFDRTFGPNSRQVDVYSTVVAPLIEEVLAGYNCTVFAYGQTGTGKTHTMVGNECAELKSSWEDNSQIGIIPRALSHLFDELRLMELEFSMRISYLELYNEELCDLLSSDEAVKIRIFDDSTKKGSVIIQGLEEIPVHSKDDVYKLLEKGKERRKTATTLMNAQSSRSHTVFSILVHIRENGIEGEEMLKTGKLNLVDLAGSENVTKAGNEKGIRARETVNINQSLLTLGRVITALVERTPHIPYRESKLTRLLQESLGGRTKTSIIATVSPGHKDIEETLSTLEYAHRAKNIQNKPEVNQKLTKKTILKEYTEEIDKLKRDLMAARDKHGIYLAEETFNEMTLKMDSQNRELNEKMLLLKALKDELQNKERVFNEVSMHLVERTEELKRTEQNLTQTKGALLQTKKVLNATKRRYKEKKVLLESHVETEEKLTTQAKQILEVADIATNDTQQLHNTIERRKDVDRKIQTAGEQFSERMRGKFECMNDNLQNLQQNQNAIMQLLLEELTNSTNTQDALLLHANAKIEAVRQFFEQSFTATDEFNKKFNSLLVELSSAHKITIQTLFEEHKVKQTAIQNGIAAQLGELHVQNNKQKVATDNMLKTVVEILQSNANNFVNITAKLNKYIEAAVNVSQDNIAEITQMCTEAVNERALAAQQQTVLQEFFEKMQALEAQRTDCTVQMDMRTKRLQLNSKASIEELTQGDNIVADYCDKRRLECLKAQQNVEMQADAAQLLADEVTQRCTAIQSELALLNAASSNKAVEICATEVEHCAKLQDMCAAQAAEHKTLHLNYEEQLLNAGGDLKVGISKDTQKLKGHTVVATSLATALENNRLEYAQTYITQLNNCVGDIDKFKQDELQTYNPTGTTPSKRNFAYPRILAATSPHNQIVKRVREENDWSDLDTTAPIDESSENDEHSIQNLSDTKTIFNSTTINNDEGALSTKLNSINMRTMNELDVPKAAVMRLHGRRSPQNSPTMIYTKENKENITQ